VAHPLDFRLGVFHVCRGSYYRLFIRIGKNYCRRQVSETAWFTLANGCHFITYGGAKSSQKGCQIITTKGCQISLDNL
jgi:hypothetical protein